MNRTFSMLVAGVMALWGVAFASESVQIKGRIVGERCALEGKIGDCFLAWANPMVLWTEDGDTYRIALEGGEVEQVALDKSFGREVLMEGIVEGDLIKAVKFTALNPPGKKEFFKG